MPPGSRNSGIYVEILIRAAVERIWTLTQEPDLHQRWDLRFSEIQYLPKATPDEAQRFLYKTRIGFGLSIQGTGESVGHRLFESGERISSLKFASDERRSLIRTGSGYWRYVPVEGGLRFITWYDYDVRFGRFGRTLDRFAFRPLIGWATSWSFDCLRLWAEMGQSPESSLALGRIHAIARVSIAAVWLWHGLVPKLLYNQIDERIMLSEAGLSPQLLPWIGAGEVLVAAVLLCSWNARGVLLVNALVMILAIAAVAVTSQEYIRAAFNPVSLNTAMVALSMIGFVASRQMPSARNCLRVDPKERG